jgi:adenylosuccinate lyase
VTRNIGVPLAHTLLAMKSLLKGLNKLLLNEEALRTDLRDNWSVIAEAIQTILRREGFPKPYEALKDLTRTHQKIDQTVLGDFIRQLEISEKVKAELLKISPESYIGICRF